VLKRNATLVLLFEEDRMCKSIAVASDDINNQHAEFTVTWGLLAHRFRHELIIIPARWPTDNHLY
jgi:hypothetical protein